MNHKKIKVTFEYSSPNTGSVVTIFVAIFGTVFVICLIAFCILRM